MRLSRAISSSSGLYYSWVDDMGSMDHDAAYSDIEHVEA